MLPERHKSLETVEEVCNNLETVASLQQLREDLDRVFELLEVEENVEVFDKCSLQLIPVLTEYLTKDYYANNREILDACKQLLNLVAQNSDAEITGHQLTSLMESVDCNETFVTLLQVLVKAVCRHPEWSKECWSRSFSAIAAYLEEVDVMNQDPKEIIDLYQAIAEFYETAIDGTEHPALLNEVKPFLIQLLGYPASFPPDASSKALNIEFGMIMDKTVSNIFRTMHDPLEFVEHPPDGMKFQPDKLAVAHLFYWVYHEGICLQAVPKVYSPNFVFQLSVDLLCTLLESGHYGLVEKALRLASHLLIPLNKEKRSHLLLERDAYGQFISGLSTAVVYDNITENRQMALKCLTIFILQFDTKGVYLIVKHLLAVQTHSGLKGYLITLYKDLFHREWGDEMSEYFKGIHLKRFLRDCCRLKGDEDSELSEDSEQIVSTLNFIRYLLLKDQNNVTQVSNCLVLLEESYLIPLRKSIQLSRNRLEHYIGTTTDEITIPKGEIPKDLIVAGKKLEPSCKEERIASLRSSLISLDVIESVLCRVVELLSEK